jgi:hypothetical protein
MTGEAWALGAAWVVIAVMLVVGLWALDRLLALGKPKAGPQGPMGWIGPPGINGKDADESRLSAMENDIAQAHAKIDSLARSLIGSTSLTASSTKDRP